MCDPQNMVGQDFKGALRDMAKNGGLITISLILGLPPLLCDARMHPACNGLESALIDAFIHVVPLILDSLPKVASSQVIPPPKPLLSIGPQVLNPTQVGTPRGPWHDMKLIAPPPIQPPGHLPFLMCWCIVLLEYPLMALRASGPA